MLKTSCVQPSHAGRTHVSEARLKRAVDVILTVALLPVLLEIEGLPLPVYERAQRYVDARR